MLRHVKNGVEAFAIHEVYYEDGKATSCTEGPIDRGSPCEG